MYVGGIPLITKNTCTVLVILKGLLGNYGYKYIILMKTHLKRDITGLFLLPTLPVRKLTPIICCKKLSTPVLSNLSTQFSKFYHSMNVQSIHLCNSQVSQINIIYLPITSLGSASL